MHYWYVSGYGQQVAAGYIICSIFDAMLYNTVYNIGNDGGGEGIN